MNTQLIICLPYDLREHIFFIYRRNLQYRIKEKMLQKKYKTYFGHLLHTSTKSIQLYNDLMNNEGTVKGCVDFITKWGPLYSCFGS